MGKLTVFLLNFFAISTVLIAQDFNIVDFGAKKDTSITSTNAINKAIDACFNKGGGKVVIPSGNFKSGTIVLKSNVELYLETGATLFASTDQKDFPRQKQPVYHSLKDKGGWFALIYAESATNIAIRGNGTINGQGAKQLPHPDLFGSDLDGRPRNILFISCQGVNVEGIKMFNSGIWNQHYLDCEDVKVNNITVYNHSNRNNDGIDIDGCRRFLLSNSIFDTDDDGICLKSTGKASCKDVIITNCIVSSYCNAIKCGTESTDGFENIIISNCMVTLSKSKTQPIFNSPNHGITGISLEIVDGGVMNNINVNNINIEGTDCPIYVRLANRARKHIPEAPEPKFGVMKNIQISNVSAYNTGNLSSSITGVPGAKIESISLKNIKLINTGGLKSGEYISNIDSIPEDEKGYPQPNIWGNLPSYGLFIRHVKNIELSDIVLSSNNSEERYPVIAVDVGKLTLRELQTDLSSGKKNVLVKEVSDIITDNNIKIEKYNVDSH